MEDSPSDTDLTVEALTAAKVSNRLSIVEDGVQAMEFLRREGDYAQAPRPDLILLDLNLPRKDGREVLAEIKADEKLTTHSRGGADHLAGRKGRAAALMLSTPIATSPSRWISSSFWKSSKLSKISG